MMVSLQQATETKWGSEEVSGFRTDESRFGAEWSESGVEGSEASTSESEGSRGSYKLNSSSKRGGIDSD